ncbi:MAG: fructosamine kinase family protein [Methylococcales bacterium]|nr:fructosamine kinase family protein [Methylococcales bacterium]
MHGSLNLQPLIRHLARETGLALQNPVLQGIGGGDISLAYKLQAADASWFIKLNRADLHDMFIAEAAGLQTLAASGALKMPEVIAVGQFRQHAYLVLNFIELRPLRAPGMLRLGEQLAQLHRQTQSWFGWWRDNTLGSTPQSNARHEGWISFWRQERLGRQLAFAAANGYGGTLQSRGEKLVAQLDGLFVGYQPAPALLHGDLWAGNAAADIHDQPVIYDPACYYGDREADIAMTELFGGFSQDFYAAYRNEYPLDSGYKIRKILYNLYHVLNHLNLFGGGYLAQANSMIERLLAELA